jgi:hypothetical protein
MDGAKTTSLTIMTMSDMQFQRQISAHVQMFVLKTKAFRACPHMLVHTVSVGTKTTVYQL